MTSLDISFPLRYRDRSGRARWSVGTASIDTPVTAPLAMQYAQPGNYPEFVHHYRIHGGKLLSETRMGSAFRNRPCMSLDKAWPEEVRTDPMRWRDILLHPARWRPDFFFGYPKFNEVTRQYEDVASPSDVFQHPFTIAPGRTLASAEDFIEHPDDEPDYDDKLARARHVVAGSMVWDGILWRTSQGPLFTCETMNDTEPKLGWLQVVPYLDDNISHIMRQALAFPATQRFSAEDAFARFTGKPPQMNRPSLPEIFITSGYDTGNMARVGEAAALFTLWEARKVVFGDADPSLVRATLALRDMMRQRWPGADFDLGSRQTASWTEPAVGADIPDAAPLGPYIEDMADRLTGKIDRNTAIAIKIAAWRVQQAAPAPAVPDADDASALDDIEFGIAKGP